eukprot:CAMPEP_0177651852 /NCGR_PEP_ID=MMETSP0447-20121125/12785_1 /TAXON_ID=0 /ORGANISM="Stygamoeba regulata, Strain BSH-02190019" /LENGTH=291 /DNA_ID=CAMNT_0019154993 /DNA_START=82 /DNA_END=957 /DNA_ORIENTATION=+
MSSFSRPENLGPAEVAYNDTAAHKYATNTRMRQIQLQMAERAYELLNLRELDGSPGKSKLILDIGCGVGLSGQILSENGHIWIGTDISRAMLDVAQQIECDGELMQHDMGEGLPFRAGMFDGAISVSALQWLCNADRKEHVPKKRLMVFFQSLYQSLARGARAVFQFYPANVDQLDMITTAAMKCGFSGGIVTDFPHSTKAKKHFLCLFAGVPASQIQMPEARGVDGAVPATLDGEFSGHQRTRRKVRGKGQKRDAVKSRNWVLAKKERQRKQGKDVRPESKFTARSRRRF